MFRCSRAMCGSALACAVLCAEADPLSLSPQFFRDASAFDAGALKIYPALSANGGYDSNIYEGRRHVVASKFWELAPELSALFPFDTGAVQATYQADRIQYSASADDSFTDQLALLRFRWEPGARHRFAGDYSWNGAHEARGTGITEGFDPAFATDNGPDKRTDRRAHVKYEFGARAAPGNVRFEFDTLQRDYTNHRERTQFFDRDEIGGGVTFLWRALPRTALLFETRARHIDYATQQPAQPSLDSREYNYLTGLEWEASEQTHAGLRVGRKVKNFASAQRENSAEFAWEINASWAPRTYSIIAADFHRAPAETNGLGDFIDLRSYALSWRHEWSERVASKIAAVYDQAFYQGVQTIAQDRNTRELQLQLNYRMQRWLNWRIAYDLRDRDSQLDALNMVRNRYTLGVEITL